MSATGRVRVLSDALAPPAGTHYPEGASLRVVHRTPRAKNDFYETPVWAIDQCLDAHRDLFSRGAPIVLDAGCGTGAISERVALRFPQAEIVGVDKSESMIETAMARGLRNAEFYAGDFATWTPETGFPDIVIMNPPYARALEFVKRAHALVRRGGTVIALLRIGFLFSRTRYEWHRKHVCDLHALTSRPSFTGGGTDASDYAWFAWHPEASGKITMLAPRAKRTIDRRKRGQG